MRNKYDHNRSMLITDHNDGRYAGHRAYRKRVRRINRAREKYSLDKAFRSGDYS